MKKSLALIASLTTFSSAFAGVTYQLTVTNGSAMPLSPAVVYSTKGSATDRAIGATTPEGLVKLCRLGDAPSRDAELAPMRNVLTHQTTEGLIMPGETRTIMVKVKNPMKEAIHFETMYGKSADVCGTISVSGAQLAHLAYHPGQQLEGRDTVLRTGAYLPPALPADTAGLCEDDNAVSCLRTLSAENTGVKYVQFFRPYLPRVLSFLDEKFGAVETDSLVIPTSGAISFTLRKH